jgi:hypothetical protein
MLYLLSNKKRQHSRKQKGCGEEWEARHVSFFWNTVSWERIGEGGKVIDRGRVRRLP